LSLKARLAIALHLLGGYCQRRGLEHPDITIFIDYLWRFIAITGAAEFEAWEAAREPPLLATALGSDFPPGFQEFLSGRGVRASEFRTIIMYTAEIVFDNLCSATDEVRSRAYLNKVALIADRHGVAWPDVSVFAQSRWADGHGWGRADIPIRLETWRNA
jgi:hypothetical protein